MSAPEGHRYVNCLLTSSFDGRWREFGIFLPPDMTVRDVARLRAYVDLLEMVADPGPKPADLRPAPVDLGAPTLPAAREESGGEPEAC